MSRECCILGHGPTRIQWDYRDGVDVFGVNNVYSFARKLTKLFVVDRITEKEFDFNALAQVKCIVASEPRPDHPEWRIEVYPIHQILEHFKTNFFSNAICFMLAYALYYEYERIYFAGIDMMTSSSYLFEKGGVEYWMGIAHAMGVPIINTKESATGRTIDNKLYGWWPSLNSDNRVSYSKAVAEESGRLVRNLMYGVPEDQKAKIDPDGHLERRDNVFRSEIEAEIKTRGILLDLAQETRDLVAEFPGFKDLSSEWVKNENGKWVRRSQKIVKE